MDQWVQYTVEYKKDKNELNFLDVTITNNEDFSYNFTAFSKPAKTNALIKLHPNISPRLTMRVFKGLLDKEIGFLMNVLAKNEHIIKVVEKVTNEYINNITCVKE